MNYNFFILATSSLIIYSLINLQTNILSKKYLYILLSSLGSTFLMLIIFWIYDDFNMKLFSNEFPFEILIILFLFSYLSLTFIFYRDILIPYIDSTVLVLISLIYIYNVFEFLKGISFYVFSIISIIPFIFIIYYILTNKIIIRKVKIFLYCYFIFMLLFIEIIYLKYFDFTKISNIEIITFEYLFFIFLFSGMIFYVYLYCFNLRMILPQRFEDETEEEMDERVLEYSNLFHSKIISDNISSYKILILCILVGLGLYLNYLYEFISPGFITEILTILTLTIYLHKF